MNKFFMGVLFKEILCDRGEMNVCLCILSYIESGCAVYSYLQRL